MAKSPSDRRGTPKGKGTVKTKTSGKIGNPPFQPTDSQRQQVMIWVATGNTRAMIARKLGVSEDTLVRHFRTELENGDKEANAMLGGVLFKKAAEGDTKALESWFDRRGGIEWRKKTGLEMSGPGGAPIETRDMSKLTPEQLAAIAALDDGAD